MIAWRFSSRSSGRLAHRCPTYSLFSRRIPRFPTAIGSTRCSSTTRSRGRAGKSLPLRIYLSAFPEIAARGEMVRALVDGERLGNGIKTGRAEATRSIRPPIFVSEAPTQPIESEMPPDDTQIEDGATGAVDAAAATRKSRLVSGLGSAPGRRSNVTQTAEQLSFALERAITSRRKPKACGRCSTRCVSRSCAAWGPVEWASFTRRTIRRRGELVALKTMRRVDPIALVRFKQEFRSLSDITHPNLVNLYELFAVEDRWFFTMELVEGGDFVSLCEEPARAGFVPRRLAGSPTTGPRPLERGRRKRANRRQARLFDEARLRDALSQLAEGIRCLHQSGKLHRDIKPPNVLVTAEGRVVLLDFGLTADLESLARQQAVDRQIVGTVGHMSPEQSAGRPITAASDWYSVGVMLYEAMTGRLPFAARRTRCSSPNRRSRPRRPIHSSTGLPEDLVRLCVALLDRDPAKTTDGP